MTGRFFLAKTPDCQYWRLEIFHFQSTKTTAQNVTSSYQNDDDDDDSGDDHRWVHHQNIPYLDHTIIIGSPFCHTHFEKHQIKNCDIIQNVHHHIIWSPRTILSTKNQKIKIIFSAVQNLPSVKYQLKEKKKPNKECQFNFGFFH